MPRLSKKVDGESDRNESRCFYCKDLCDFMLTENGLPVCNSKLCLRRATEGRSRPVIKGEFVRINLPTHNERVYKVVNNISAVIDINADDDIPTFPVNGAEAIPMGVPLETECVDWKAERLGIFPDAIMRPGYAHLHGFDSNKRWRALVEVLTGNKREPWEGLND